MKSLTGLIILGCLFACGTAKNGDGSKSASPLESSHYENVNENQYASGFRITQIDKNFELSLMDPWNSGEIFARYLITEEGADSKKQYDDIKIISPPFDRWAVSSTTHIGFLDALGESGRIVGCTSPDRIYNRELSAKYNKGEIEKIGSDMEFNFESVLGIEPDIILQTAFEGQKKKDQSFHSTNLDFIYILEWMEPHPLGRAEWIKVFGLLTGKTKEADSVFQEVANHYNHLKEKVSGQKTKPLVMMGNNFNGTWYMPGGQNYMCRFFEDAGYDYPLIDSDNRGSLALNFENVLNKFRTAEIWLGVSARNMDELLKSDSRYSLFDPAAKGMVYSVNGRLNDNLGNDYWESGVVFPNLILADLVSIAHPSILPDFQLMYYKKLSGGR